METIRRPRAILLAAAVAVGSGPLFAQTGDPSVSVAAPQAIQTAPGAVSPFSLVPDAVQSAGFRPNLVTTTGPVQKLPVGETTQAPSATPTWAPAAGETNTTIGPPQVGTANRAMPVFNNPVAAPAWRWHGYGAVIVSDPPPSTPGSRMPQLPATAPTGSAVSALPTATEATLGTTPAVDANPAPLPAPATSQPLSANEPAWRSAGDRVSLANPMSAGPDRWAPAANSIVTVSASSSCRGPAVTLEAPRPAGTYISRGVSEAPSPPPAQVQPVSYTAPAPPARPMVVPVPTAIRLGIERVAAGRGRDLEVTAVGPASLLVRLKVRQPYDAEYLANAISRMPELAPYQVQFQIQVAR